MKLITMSVSSVVDEATSSSFDEIDVLLEGTSREDKTKAYGLLLELYEEVILILI